MDAPISWEAAAVAIGDTADALSAIHDPGYAAAIWRRTMPRAIRDRVAMMDPDALPRTRAILRPGLVGETVGDLCAGAAPEDRNALDWLAADVTALAARFTTLLRAPWLRLRLDVVTGNSCRKFHVDTVTARLICTYRGAGTQYGLSTDGAADPARILTVPTGAPVVLRGTGWPAEPDPGLLHRSPPIDGTGETRLLLVLDPILDPEDEI